MLTRRTLIRVLESALRLLHPFMPFITEEIWQKVRPLAGNADGYAGETIVLAPYPVADADAADPGAVAEIQWVQQFILGVRRIKGEMNIAPGKPLPVLVQDAGGDDLARIERHELYLQNIARLESLTRLGADETAPPSATALLGGMKILVPMAGLVDVDAFRPVSLWV